MSFILWGKWEKIEYHIWISVLRRLLSAAYWNQNFYWRKWFSRSSYCEFSGQTSVSGKEGHLESILPQNHLSLENKLYCSQEEGGTFLVAFFPHVERRFTLLHPYLHSLRDLCTLQKQCVLTIHFSSTLDLCETLFVANCLSVSLSVAVQ